MRSIGSDYQKNKKLHRSQGDNIADIEIQSCQTNGKTMASTNTDYVVGLIVDGVLASMRSQLNGKVPDAVLDTVRSGAILAASSAIPPPVRLAINAVPASTVMAAGNAAANKVRTVKAGAEAVGNLIRGK